ncbi:MAG: septum formation initiator family protein [Actinomycetota bacterium]|nr:septum formation initiator family protein [Actinomycetota bacterium]
MVPAPSRRIDPHAVTAAPRAPRRRPTAVAGGGQRIRWDRLSRVAILLVLVGVAALYVGPLVSFWSARGEAATRRVQVEQLREENTELRAKREALKNGGALEAEARRLGMIRPGERPFVVENLPGGP